jgi:hypothetical protein
MQIPHPLFLPQCSYLSGGCSSHCSKGDKPDSHGDMSSDEPAAGLDQSVPIKFFVFS